MEHVVVEPDVAPLLVLRSDVLWFLEPLEPSVVPLVEPPVLLLQGLGREVLRVRAGLVIKREEEGLAVEPLVAGRIRKGLDRGLTPEGLALPGPVLVLGDAVGVVPEGR